MSRITFWAQVRFTLNVHCTVVVIYTVTFPDIFIFWILIARNIAPFLRPICQKSYTDVINLRQCYFRFEYAENLVN